MKTFGWRRATIMRLTLGHAGLRPEDIAGLICAAALAIAGLPPEKEV